MKTLTIQEATELAVEKMVRAGVAREEAEIAAPIYVEGDLCGRPSHGLRHLYNNLIQFELGAPMRRPLQILNETPFSALVDGGYHQAYYVNAVAMKLCIEKARQIGIGMVAHTHDGGSGILSYYTRTIAEAGFIGIALASPPAVVVPMGGLEPMLGTNPISVSVPRRDAPPIILDMATSAGTFNQIMLARMTGKPLPPDIALGPDGQPTLDPLQALNEYDRPRLLPLAGAKGYGLALMVALLAGAGAGGGIARQTGIVHHPDHFHGLFVAYRPDLFVSLDDFNARMEEFIADLAQIERVPGVDRVRLPGDETHRKRSEALARGTIEIEDATHDFLTS
jgi:LDH2 family malate/lactate/ureidoglycolate dehydrogenase